MRALSGFCEVLNCSFPCASDTEQRLSCESHEDFEWHVNAAHRNLACRDLYIHNRLSGMSKVALDRGSLNFRAGIEACISFLKRVFGFTRVLDKGLESFKSAL